MMRTLAKRLLIRTYCRVSAVCCFDIQGKLSSIQLYSTDFPCRIDVPKETDEIWLMSNHPEGGRMPYAKDLKMACALCKRKPQARMRVFITNEDFICREFRL